MCTIYRSFLIVFALLFVSACKKEKASQPTTQTDTGVTAAPVNPVNGPVSRIQLLRVDYLTYSFEGGAEVTLSSTVTVGDTLPIAVTYTAPGDFGWVTLKLASAPDTLFSGGVVWMGKGQIDFPNHFDAPSTFITVNPGVQIPASGYVTVHVPVATSPLPPLDLTKTWSAIGNLKVVKDHLAKNRKIRLFLYTPSVGMGDPADWDWFFFLCS